MGLKEYRAKRDFRRTQEPAGETPRGSASKRRTFFVQKHAATHLHYDFRLEHRGVLLSWAIPKGPSLDSSVKRLAVQVEDHPLAYGSFEGTIAQGLYGAGSVIVWDRGTWTPEADVDEGLSRGRLLFELAGARLRGAWKLVRMASRGETKAQWLLVKSEDEFARGESEGSVVADYTTSVVSNRSVEEVTDGVTKRDSKKKGASRKPAREQHPGTARPRASKPLTKSKSAPRKTGGTLVSRVSARRVSARAPRKAAPAPSAVRAELPDFVAPQLARLVTKIPEGDDWIHEIKLDGYRMQVRRDGDRVTWTSRNQLDWSGNFADLDPHVLRWPCRAALLDVEVVCLGEDGASSFSALQQALSEDRSDDLVVYAFDLLHLDGWDLRECTLLDRKVLLHDLLGKRAAARVRFSEHAVGRGEELLPAACARELEGIVSKVADSPYVSGRDGSWTKTKCGRSQEFVVIGWSSSKAARSGIGALLLAHHDGGVLVSVGRVGSGFDARTAAELAARLAKIERSHPAREVTGAVSGPGVHWVDPKLVAQVGFAGWTHGEQLRHARFLGLRTDKSTRDVVREVAHRTAPTSSLPEARVKKHSAKRPADRSAASKSPSTRSTRVTLTHPDRVVDAESGARKIDVAAFVERYAERMLPHVAGRPLSMLRCPSGVGGPCFFQRHANGRLAAGLSEIDVGGTADYVIVEDERGLAALVQDNVLEFHPWGATSGDPELPDRMVFDLDPAEDVPWSRVVDGARAVRSLLERLDLETVLKTSGGKGLHVVAPLTGRDDWERVSSFARAVADQLARDDGGFIATASKRLRQGRIFVDYLRNRRGSTTVAPWSPRARTGLPVSVPIPWSALGRTRAGDDAHVLDMTSKRISADAWSGWSRIRQKLPRTGR